MLNREKFNQLLSTTLLVALIVVLVLIPIMADSYWVLLLITIFVGCMYGLTFRIVMLVGELSFAQGGMLSIGAYTSALLATKTNLNFCLELPLSGVMAAVVALVLGRSILKLHGMFFALVTFCFSEFLRRIYMEFSFFGRVRGISNIPDPSIRIPGFIDMTVRGPENYYYLGLFLLAVTCFVAFRLDRSQIGKIYSSVRQNENLAESIGINVMRYKVQAFVISSFLLGVAGSFCAHFFSYLNPDTFTLTQSIDSIVYAMLGGLANILGPILGAFVVIGVMELLPVSSFVKIMSYAIVLILVLVFAPDGLLGLPSSISRLIKGRKAGTRVTKGISQ
jgi:branched-chain amino acid transport system permease protein